MNNRIDARGLSCPQPVVLCQKKMKESSINAFEVIVETQTACDNITRMAKKNAWTVNTVNDEDDIILTLKRS